ncbi:glycosyltransferase family 39 protein [Lysobacter sp. LF1]|uniref:Glycosyltransferase family 39 protein n=1 Tax=Lysobacter stagni TaxID=3045172 RepID=A0ABT6XFJ5_9GAMM|nr:glycosyltransferase family 39 protein [Lysobacter sp. LF1]MDI9238834.1 glycosyltransferase family 39 protein [Lysobacter sp. LF1]
MHVRRKSLLLSLLLAFLTAAILAPGLSGGFLLDDFPNIVTNTRVHAQSLNWDSLVKAASAYQAGSYGRPLATISFAIDYSIGGKDPWVFKLSSLLVHVINALLVFWLVRRLFSLDSDGKQRGIAAAFAVSLIWAIHPIQVSSALYVVQRMETLSLTFVLLALLAYLRGRVLQQSGDRRGWLWLGGSALLAGVGMLGKETAALFPLYTLALELTVLGFRAGNPLTTRTLKWAYALGLGAALLVFVFAVLPPYLAPHAFDGRDFTLYERLLTQCRVLCLYLGQILLPLPSSLTFYYDNYAKSTGWLSPPTTLLCALLLVALLAGAWRLRRTMPYLALGILWFFAGHALTSNVFNLELVFEHRNYFALLGVLLALAELVRLVPSPDGPTLKRTAVAAVVVGFGFLALLRASTWGNQLHLAMDLVAKNPASTRASSDLATLYIALSGSDPNSPFFDMGRQEFERGSRLPNASPLPEQGLILMAATTGQPVDPAWWDRIIHKVRTRPVGTQEIMAVAGLMQQRYRGIELDDRRLSELYGTLLDRAPMPASMYAQYGDFALKYLKDEALADRMFVAAIERNPKDDAYAQQVLGTLVEDGHVRQAKAVMERAHAIGLIQNKGG